MRFWLLPLLALAGCGGGGGEPPAPAAGAPAQAQRPVVQSDLEIAALLYSDRERTPAGFPLELAPAGYDQVTTTHLAGCTDDWDEALSWAEVAAQDAPTYSDLVATVTDTRYFEFGRVLRAPTAGYVRMRVYRCAFFDPVAGTLNSRPLTAELVSAFAAYQWQFTPYNNFGNAVLGRSTQTTAGTIEHRLDLATLTRAVVAGGCDTIDVLAWVWRVTLATGKVVIETSPLFAFDARFTDGAAAICPR